VGETKTIEEKTPEALSYVFQERNLIVCFRHEFCIDGIVSHRDEKKRIKILESECRKGKRRILKR